MVNNVGLPETRVMPEAMYCCGADTDVQLPPLVTTTVYEPDCAAIYRLPVAPGISVSFKYHWLPLAKKKKAYRLKW